MGRSAVKTSALLSRDRNWRQRSHRGSEPDSASSVENRAAFEHRRSEPRRGSQRVVGRRMSSKPVRGGKSILAGPGGTLYRVAARSLDAIRWGTANCHIRSLLYVV
jgi:hypothetical protein